MSKNKLISYIILLINILALSVGCTNGKNALVSNELEIEIKEYSIQDEENNIDVHISYPQLISKQEAPELSEINELLYDFFIIEPENGLFYNSDYEIKSLNSEIISIVKKDNSHVKESPYPMSSFDAINISVATASILNFNEILSDEALSSAIEEGRISLVKGVNDLLDLYSYQDFVDMFLNQTEKVYYVTDSSIGIVVYLNHASGDYAVLEISLDV